MRSGEIKVDVMRTETNKQQYKPTGSIRHFLYPLLWAGWRGCWL